MCSSDAWEKAFHDVCRTWPGGNVGVCADCGMTAERNSDARCIPCAVDFTVKLRSVAVIAEPWGLKEARAGGFATY